MVVDAEFFARRVLAGHCRLPFAEVHRQLFAWHREMAIGFLPTRRGRRFVLAAPRGSAKSTVASLALILHDVVFRQERYIVLLSATERQARQRLRAISSELFRGPAGKWVPNRIDCSQTAASIVFNGVRIDAFGAGTEIRGISFGELRPTKIVLDDAEASRSAASPRAREKLLEWFTEIVEHLGDVYTHILAIGTVLHDRGLIAELMRRSDFDGKRFQSIESFSSRADLWAEWRGKLLDFADPRRRETAREFFEARREEMLEGTSVLWPEKEDYEQLFAQLTFQGRRAFYQEKQNTPLGPDDAFFDGEKALLAAIDAETIEVLVPHSRVAVRRYGNWRATAKRFGYLDAAMGKGGRRGSGDFAVLATVLSMPDGTLIVESIWARRASPTDQVRRLFDAHAAGEYITLGIEGTGFQELMATLIAQEGLTRSVRLPVRVVHPKKSKLARIAALEPLLTNGSLALAPGLDEEFWEELANYPRTPHDDALDALAGAVALAKETRGLKMEPAIPRNRGRGMPFL